MKIVIQSIPHHLQRYDTVGDWYKGDRGTLNIMVSEMKNWRSEACVAIHELVEALLCIHDEVSEKEVDRFDLSYEGEGEPGDDLRAPYYAQHQAAMTVERLLVFLFSLDWNKHEEAIEDVSRTWKGYPDQRQAVHPEDSLPPLPQGSGNPPSPKNE